MRVPSHPTLIRRMLDRRLSRCSADEPVLAASLNPVNKRWGQPSCRCHRDGPSHPAHHLSYKEDGKTHTVYVPRGLVAEVQSWVAGYRRLEELMGEISQLSLALVRNHSKHQKRKRAGVPGSRSRAEATGGL